RRRGDTTDPRSARPPGPSGRRQYARLRQEPFARRGERADRIHGDAALARRAAGPEHVVPPVVPPVTRDAPMIATEPPVVVPVLVAAALYARGYVALARRMPDRFGPWRIVSFMTGSAVTLISASPWLDELSHALLQAHMSQHLMLMLIAPPLLWMGAPVAP